MLAILQDAQTAIQKDLKLNFKRLVEDSSLSAEDANLIILAIGATLKNSAMMAYGKGNLSTLGTSPEVVAEATESAAIMGMLNTYYRFRHFIQQGQGEAALEAYKQAGLRMMSLGNPAMGKERFEMLATAISAINGCEMCINAHEQALRKAGLSADQIHDVVRLACVLKGVDALAE